MAISSPSDETAIASITSDVLAANWLSSQLNRCASLLGLVLRGHLSVSEGGWREIGAVSPGATLPLARPP
jgi:hypothetical protein